MFSIFHGDVLISRSELENGDPPMGVAFGRFVPTDAFAALRSVMKPGRDGAGKEQPDIRYIASLRAKTANGIELRCSGVAVCEYSEATDPFALEVSCLGIEEPPYKELFPDHVEAYANLFKKMNAVAPLRTRCMA